MNTFYQNSYRINALIFLSGLLLLVFVGQQRFTAVLHTLDSMAGALTTTPARASQSNPPALLLLQADALVLPMNNGAAQVTARVRDAQGNPVAGSLVQFQSVLGSVNPTIATTDGNGAATATFQATGTAGHALITANVNDLNREAAIQLVNPATSATTNALTLDFGPSQLDPGQTATINAVLRDSAGQPVAGELVTLFGSLGEVTPASAMSDATGHVTASYHAGSNAGAAMITALAGVAAKSVTFQVGAPGAPDPSAHKVFLPMVSR
ncbi:MAG: Ig-like domain-containing protein [Chloroflexi bacterium]|nr:Ig-like domain-containing protein [Chloroflexota bacterium]